MFRTATACVLALSSSVALANTVIKPAFDGDVCVSQTVLAVDDQWFVAGASTNGPPADADNAPNAVAAQQTFVGALSPFATNGFESGEISGNTITFTNLDDATFAATGTSGLSAIACSGYSNGFRPAAGSCHYAINNQNGVKIEFGSPVQAVGFYIADALEKQDVTVTCANGDTETITLAGTNCPNLVTGCNPIAYFARVNDPLDQGTWCTSIEIVSQGNGDSFSIDELTIGSCDAALVTQADCECEHVCATSASNSVTIAFAEGVGGPCQDCR